KRLCKIIQIASLLSFQGGFRTSGYTASKHGIIGMTKLLANEWGRYGINVNAVAPGYIRTNMSEEFLNNTEISDRFFQRISLGRWGKPEDVAAAVLFFASPAADYIQGTTIIVDGGYSVN
ncbi:MAG: SDR family oxidoreductase, partial [Candidatus Methanoperedens sp.]|nr:SDR family oxidoreductase [Candidatus Methanoperedens sp.]